MKVIVPEFIHPEALELLQSNADTHVDPELYRRPAALAAAMPGAQGLIVRNQTRVDAALLEHALELKVVGRVGVGLDNLDLPALQARGVTTTWAPGTNAVSVAEYVLGAMLELLRRFGPISQQLHQGSWDRRAAIGSEVFGKTLGILGLGDIGSRLAKRARAFGLQVMASDPQLHKSSFAVQEYGVVLTEAEVLLGDSDIISLHTPLLPSTHHLIDEAALALMKPSAFLINTARGGLIDETALATALRQGRLAGAALDVREQEPPGEDDPLRGLDNVILTPHMAGVTEESMRRASLHVVNDVLRVLAGERPVSPVPAGAGGKL